MTRLPIILLAGVIALTSLALVDCAGCTWVCEEGR
jgi:hypothetical protein